MSSRWIGGVATPPFSCYNIFATKNKMSIKLALLKSGETIISDAKEVVMDGDDPNDVKAYLLENPHVVTTRAKQLLTEDSQEPSNDYSLDVVLSPWLVLSKDRKMIVPSDWVVTILEPLVSVVEMYQDKCNASLNIESQEKE